MGSDQEPDQRHAGALDLFEPVGLTGARPRVERQAKERFVGWCAEEVWQAGFDDEPSGFVTCGGELRYARRMEDDAVVSYLVCLFCGNLTKIAKGS